MLIIVNYCCHVCVKVFYVKSRQQFCVTKTHLGRIHVNEEKIIVVENNLNNIQNNVVIVTIPFKVKDDAKFGESVVSVSDIAGSHVELETGDSTNYTGTSEDLKLNIVEQKNEEVVKLNEIRVTKNPNKISYNVGEKFDPEGMIITAYYSDNSSSIISNYTYSQRDELKESDNKITISYTEGNETKETTIDIEVSKKNGSETQSLLDSRQHGYPRLLQRKVWS